MNARKTVLFGGCLLGIAAISTQGATMRFVPTNATGTHVIAGSQITLTGTPQRVYLEVQITGWTPSRVKVYQTTLDCASLTSGTTGVLSPALLGCASDATCNAAIPGGYGPGATCTGVGIGKCLGGINKGLQCFSDTDCPASTCARSCENAFVNTADSRFVFAGATAIAATNTSVCDVGWGATTLGTPVTDPGNVRYGGTFAVDVPAGAVGTFSIKVKPNQDGTFLIDEFDQFISLTHTPDATIVVKCTSNANCNDNNECTTDSCNQGTGLCANQPNFDGNQFCCNPTNGDLATLTDNNQCTGDVCDPLTGQVSHPNLPNGAACGNPSSTQCDRPDTCDGAGVCQPRFEVLGTACGSSTNNECNLADTCNGTGTCLSNIQPAGTACESQTSGPCDAPNSCNGLGGCLSNTVANNTPCDDSLFCTLNEKCQAGICGGGTPRNCLDLLSCTTDTCNETLDQCDHSLDAGSCLIDDVCYLEGVLNPGNTCEECDTASSSGAWTVLSDGSTCNDGNACTGTGRPGIGVDTCTGGVCAGVPDPQCNDQCEFAVPAIVGTNFSNNSSAGADDGEASCQIDSNNDVWFEYTADCDGELFVSTTGSTLAPSNDTVLNIFDNCPGNGGVEITCDDDSGAGLQSALIFATTQSTTYYIRVAGFEDNKGPIQLNVTPAGDCLIDGVCYLDGEVNPENGCQACIPEISTTQWAPLFEGTPCGNSADTQCDSPDACDGTGICEVNYKPDATLCDDEGNICTKNFCDAGVCIHPPEPAGLACGDPTNTECDNPDTCDGGGNCNPRFEDAGFQCGDQTKTNCDAADTCDGVGICLDNLRIDGTLCDDGDICTKQDRCLTGVCVGINRSSAPTVVGFGGLAIKVTPLPANSPAPVALRVTSPTWPCLDKYITATGTLSNVPVFQSPAVWGTITVYDPDIVPNSTYVVVAECGTLTSDPGQGTTGVWGDVNLDGHVDFLDLSLLVDVFKGKVPNAPLVIFDLQPCDGNAHIDFLDISTDVDAFQGDPYPCAVPCP